MTGWEAQFILIGQIAFAMLLGGVIGWERELADKPAGFRTHMLIAGAAALFVGLAFLLTRDYQSALPNSSFRADPVRVLQAVVVGVSFLGAGTIFRGRGGDKVGGLTSAATILLVTGVGMACALGHYVLAICVTVLTLIVLRVIVIVERRKKKP